MPDTNGYEIFKEIIYGEIPPRIDGFFENLKASSRNNTAGAMIAALNDMLTSPFTIKSESEETDRQEASPVDILTWFELLHCIYVIRWHNAERTPDKSYKQPVFTTFRRSFEHASLYGDYWFNSSAERKNKKKLISSPHELLIAFKRYMLDANGAFCWEALDFNINKYIFRCICEPAAGKTPEDPCAQIAAVILTAHQIAAGMQTLYIGESKEIDLRYAGVKTGDPALLKYFNFDRITRYSYIRQNELDLDADKTVPYPSFSPQWHAMAALTEGILQEKGARATKTTAMRVSLGTLLKCLTKLLSENTMQDDPKAMFMLEKGIALIDSEDFTKLSPQDVLAQLSLEDQIIPVDFYVKRYVNSAREFWALVQTVFNPLLDKFESKYYTLLSGSPAAIAGTPPVSVNEDSRKLLLCLQYAQTEELRGRLTGERLRSALANLLLSGDLEFDIGQLSEILNKTYTQDSLRFFSPSRGRKIPLHLPCQWVCDDWPADKIASELSLWAKKILSQCSKTKHEVTWDFTAVDFEAIQEASDKIWEIYFGPQYEDAVRTRYIISLETARQILEGGKDRYAGVKLVTGAARNELIRYINSELRALTGVVDDVDLADEKKAFSKERFYCFADFRPTSQRGIVILDVIARLIVTVAKHDIFAAIWKNTDERIRFITHILAATHSNLEHPFPFHIGLQGDTVLRISRSGTDQGDHLSRLATHQYVNMSERYVFLLALTKYLKRESTPVQILQAIIADSSLAAFAAPDQLHHLKDALTSGGM